MLLISVIKILKYTNETNEKQAIVLFYYFSFFLKKKGGGIAPLGIYIMLLCFLYPTFEIK
jgi:hypothetical protein